MPHSMTQFALLFRGRQSFDSPERARQNAQAWQAWFKELGARGHFKEAGHRTPLESAGKVVWGSEKMVSEGPYAEAKDVVSGYTLIEAADFGDAVELSKGCPILDVGGSVEVRPVQNFKA
jgi:hypothetical protein